MPDLEQTQWAPFKESPFRATHVSRREEQTKEGKPCMLRAQGDSAGRQLAEIFWGKVRQACKAAS